MFPTGHSARESCVKRYICSLAQSFQQAEKKKVSLASRVCRPVRGLQLPPGPPPGTTVITTKWPKPHAHTHVQTPKPTHPKAFTRYSFY
ncbi:hypothetical protein IF1G_08128 [Cordyceps javanica]|uniref:Uncharacterized protein n=1 Tax=Cordyceps javanica TaxID=43265 RepID=A0A545UVQ4_9HYPO|nr:hypothetical protein IF1G_08128 [Cordyceps javanica]